MSPHSQPLEVLLEDNHLLVVSKPALLPTMGVSPDRPSLYSLAKAYIRHKYHKPGGVYLGIVSRLDAPVSGAVVLARTSKAAARLAAQFRSRSVAKVYWAVVEGRMNPQHGTLVGSLCKDERRHRMRMSAPDRPGASTAKLEYRTLRHVPGGTLLEIHLLTGRKHQIRVQLAHQGRRILGDHKYGSRRPFACGIALHCRRLEFAHPTRGNRVCIVAPLPRAWRESGISES
jgi:23S rRNA pseudouridine1911/1915/1917 synthase